MDVKFKERIAGKYPPAYFSTFEHSGSDVLAPDKGYGNWFGFGTHVSSDALVGNHIRLNVGACISSGNHGNTVNDFCFFGINSTVCGGAKIGKGAAVNSNAVIINKNISVGDYAVIGAGSVVTKDVKANTVVYGNPAKEPVVKAGVKK
jgi:acetyltransferase EpsM